MQLSFRSQPGYWERHLARRYHNPLFNVDRRDVSEQALSEARRRDNDELHAFQEDFRKMLEDTAALEGNVDSDIVLKLKEQADRLYEHSVGLAVDLSQEREAIAKLVTAMMAAVSQGATGDPRALDELLQEREARAQHYRLLESVLIADLLRPDGPLQPQDLLPALLSSEQADLEPALQLFDEEQLTVLAEQGRALLAERAKEGVALPESAQQRLEQITAALAGR
ncbi:MAG: hypothetical protein PVF52_00085 [Granulosicoccaceae bacterium]|jgi:hypothetical protein